MTSSQSPQPPDPETILSSLPPIPAASASVLALSSRISALEQSLSFESSSSPPLCVHLPPLPPLTSTSAASPQSASAATTSSSASTTSSSAAPSASSNRKSRDSLSSSASSSSLSGDAAASSSLSFLSKAEELSSRLQGVEDDALTRFFALHAQYEALLSSSASLSSFLSAASVKQQLLHSHYEPVMTAQRDLQALASLLPDLRAPPLTVTAAQLDALEEAQRRRLVDVAQLHVAVDRFTAAYDDAVHALNAALVKADRKVRAWEARVDQHEMQMQRRAAT